MWETYYQMIHKYPRNSLCEERRLIAQAKKYSKNKSEELVLRHVGFVIFRINRKVFPSYRERFGEDILSRAVFILYDKIKSYNLNYKDKQGNPKPVRFASYIWKRIDGFIIDYLRKETEKERLQFNPDWERFDQDYKRNILTI